MQLYGNYMSPFVRHCRIALIEEGMQCEFIEADYQMMAEKSPISKMPLLIDGDLMLTDSSSMLKYIREQSGKQQFLADLGDYENFALTNTVLDSVVNVFILGKEGFGATQIKYVGRQQERINNGMQLLNQRFKVEAGEKHDVKLDSFWRCSCFLDWGILRQCIDLAEFNHLQAMLDEAHKIPVFMETAAAIK